MSTIKWVRLVIAAVAITLAMSAASVAAECKFSNLERVKKHATAHLKYPSSGKEIKLACKKEWPDEFSKEEWACLDSSIKDDTTYKSSAEVLKAVGVE